MQPTLWIKRAHCSSRDNWRVDLYSIGLGNPLSVHTNFIDKKIHPILSGIVGSFAAFNKAFTNTTRNFKKAFFFNNPAFQRSSTNGSIIDMSCFHKTANLYLVNIKIAFLRLIC